MPAGARAGDVLDFELPPPKLAPRLSRQHSKHSKRGGSGSRAARELDAPSGVSPGVSPGVEGLEEESSVVAMTKYAPRPPAEYSAAEAVEDVRTVKEAPRGSAMREMARERLKAAAAAAKEEARAARASAREEARARRKAEYQQAEAEERRKEVEAAQV